MIIDSIQNGIVIDHIKAGKSMDIYQILDLSSLDSQVAIIKNASSKKRGKKDLIKINATIELNLDVIGYIDPDITVNYIRDGKIIEKKHLELPEIMTNVIFCSNPRCITSTEQELPHIFKLTDRSSRTYRCIYCESRPKAQDS